MDLSINLEFTDEPLELHQQEVVGVDHLSRNVHVVTEVAVEVKFHGVVLSDDIFRECVGGIIIDLDEFLVFF
jgi:hypothetical protein